MKLVIAGLLLVFASSLVASREKIRHIDSTTAKARPAKKLNRWNKHRSLSFLEEEEAMCGISGCPTLQACVTCTARTDEDTLVTLVSTCNNCASLSWMCCLGTDVENTACEATQCDGSLSSTVPPSSDATNKCEESREVKIKVPSDARFVTMQIHDGNLGGLTDTGGVLCAAGAANECCGGGGAANGNCADGYDVNVCQINVNISHCAPLQVDSCCDTIDCGDHGTCENGSCNCEDGWSGPNCEDDACAAVTCDNECQECSDGECVPVEGNQPCETGECSEGECVCVENTCHQCVRKCYQPPKDCVEQCLCDASVCPFSG